MNPRSNCFAAIAVLFVSPAISAQALPPELKAKLDAKVKDLQAWSTDPAIVGGVKAYNTTPPPGAEGMTNDKWKTLTVLDPVVRSFNKNPVGVLLKSRQAGPISEIFVSGADGGKVAFIAKTSSWTHKGKDKHEVPMKGRVWFGPVEVDESTGLQQVQVAVPVLDGGKPIGSIVVGFSVQKL